MKKIYLYILFTVIILPVVNSQKIGINNNNPEQLLHIDAKGDNETGDAGKKTNDIVVTNNGTLGVGTSDPLNYLRMQVEGDVQVSDSLMFGKNGTAVVNGLIKAKRIGVNLDGLTPPQALLHIVQTGQDKPLFRLADTSEKDGYMLTSDASGNAYWEALRPMSSVAYGTFLPPTAIDNDFGSYVRTNITKDSLELPPGTWLIMANTSTTGLGTSNFVMYMELYSEHNGEIGSGTELLVTAASKYENLSSYKANMNLMYVAEVPIPKESGVALEPGNPKYITRFIIKLKSSYKYAASTGDGAFYAIRLDRQH